ncbi:MAG: hypothetical protein ABFC96_10995 [Thermoguttaceae bacterium]
MENQPDKTIRHGFSIGTLLLLMTIVAIFLAAARTVVVNADRAAADALGSAGTTPTPSGVASAIAGQQEHQEEAAMRGVAGAVIGLLVGVGIGATRPRPVLGALLGILVGVPTGGVAGGILTQPENAPLALIGPAILLLMGGLIYHLSAHRGDG